MARAMLLEVTAVTVLSFAMTADGLADVRMASAADPVPERDMLLGVEAELSGLGQQGLVVTHNGVAHDARLIARRCMRHWLHALFAFALVEAGPERHFDTMLRFGGRAEGGPGARWSTSAPASACRRRCRRPAGGARCTRSSGRGSSMWP